MPVLDRSNCASAEGTAKGAYIICDTKGVPDVILIATGSEVHIAITAAELLAREKISARVVSAPSLEWFEDQNAAYREEVLPSAIKARVSIEAGVGSGWYKYVGDSGEIISLEHFGASASASELFKEYGFTPENIVAAALRTIARS